MNHYSLSLKRHLLNRLMVWLEFAIYVTTFILAPLASILVRGMNEELLFLCWRLRFSYTFKRHYQQWDSSQYTFTRI